MTNNDKALAEATEDEIKASFVEFINWVKPNTGLSPSTVGTIQKVFKEALSRQALTPQSSADLGRVLKVVDNCLRNSRLDAERRICLMEAIRNGLDEVIGRAE